MTQSAKQITLRRLTQAMLSAPSGSRAHALLEAAIDGIADGYDLSGNQSDSALVENFLTGVQQQAILQDTHIAWTPRATAISVMLGLFAYQNAVGLPGITSLTVKATTSREGYDLQGLDDCETLSFPNLETLTETGYLHITGDGLTSISFPVLTDIGGSVVIGTDNLTSLDFSSLVTLAHGLTLQGSSLTALSLPSLTDMGVGQLNLNNNALMTSFSAPVFAGSASAVNLVNLFSCDALASISVPMLAHVSDISVYSDPLLTALSFPALIGLGKNGETYGLHASGSPIVTVSIPVCLPLADCVFDFSGCALNVASVNHILARCIANVDYVTGTVDLSGGTNAVPTGQGLTDKAALILRGVTVTTNT